MENEYKKNKRMNQYAEAEEYYKLIKIFLLLKDYQKMNESLVTSTKLYLELLSDDLIENANIYEKIARNYRWKKEYDEALRYYKLQSICYGKIEDIHDLGVKRKKATVFYHIGLMYSYLGNDELKIMAYRKSQTIREQIYQETNDDEDLEELVDIRLCLSES